MYSTLKECFDLNGSDKSFKHKYDTLYEPFMASRRNDPINLLEIGVFRGNSIAAWLDYFPNATIYCVDIFERVSPEDIEILKHPRGRWAKCDSTKGVPSEWADVKFDFIIDDGLHTPDANRLTFLNYFPHCTGHYFIEDVWPLHDMSSYQLKHPWIRGKAEYTLEPHQMMLETLRSHGLVFHHDLRPHTRQPDSYVLVILP